MRRMLLRAFVRRLGKDRSGLALTEFALSLPVLLVLILMGLEVANFALAHMRVSQIANSVADNAGRVNTVVDEANINEVFAGAELIGESIDFIDNGRIVLSSLQPNNMTGWFAGQMINWQRCDGSLGVAPAYGWQGRGRFFPSLRDGMGRPGNRIIAAPGTAVMFVEVTYEYQPLVSEDILGPNRRIRYESAMNVRERTNLAITNTQSLPLNDCFGSDEGN